MKYLQDYIEEEQTKLFEELGVFFAFSTEQFKEGADKYMHLKPEGTKWASMGMGMYLPSVNVDQFIDRHEKIIQAGIARDLEENGREGILMRELGNYEIGYTRDPYERNFRDALKGYDFTEEEIGDAYNKYIAKIDEME